MTLRVVFMGTPDFAVPALKSLCERDVCDVIAVYTQPPRPKGRGGHVQKSPIHILAEENNIPVLTPLSFKKDPHAVQEFQNLNADIVVVAAYGLILPQTVLDAPRLGCVNIHGSILPRWRGASPVQHAILYDTETGVTLMQMEAGLDTGPMIAIQKTKIADDDTTSVLMARLADMGAQMIAALMDQCGEGKDITIEKQNDALSTYAPLIKKEHGLINWNDKADQIDRKIRAFNPWPGTYSFGPKGKVKILSTQKSSHTHHGPNGVVLSAAGEVTCGMGTILTLDKVQPDNAKAMTVVDAINGGYLQVGQMLRDAL